MAGDEGRIHSAIVLQGGGALGAYECGVLQALYESRPDFRPVVVTGISSGALNAAVLGGAKDDPVSALTELWRNRLTVSAPFPTWLPPLVDRYLSVLGNPGMYRLNPQLAFAPWRAASIYDTAPLGRTLADLVDTDKLNAEHPRVVVGAINVASGEMEYFDRDGGPRGLTIDHVIASGSLPPGFPMADLDRQRYWDGGLFSNLPLAPAINALEKAANGDRAAIRELIVVELFPMTAPIPRNLLEVQQRMIQLQYTSRLRLDEEFFDKIGRFADMVAQVDDLLAQAEGQFPRARELRADETYQQLLEHRRIDHFSVVTSTLSPDLSIAVDFSRSTIDERIRTGHEDAVKQGIGQVDSPGLRPGETGG
jgi:NTE family protein